jgi:hypothetical protein
VPTKAPTKPCSSSNDIVSYINSVTLSGKTLSVDGITPLDKALKQLVVSNQQAAVPLSTCVAAEIDRLRQRFAYLALVFSTGTEGAFGFANRFASASECSWQGITCNSNRVVTGLDLSDQNLQGTIPPDVGLWTSLTSFSVHSNQLVGSLPSTIGAWTGLTYFMAINNQLTGNVPKEVTNWLSIKNAYFTGNNLQGTMPTMGTNFCPRNLPRTTSGRTLQNLGADCSKVACSCCNQCS